MPLVKSNHHLQLLRAILLRGVANRRLGRGDVPAIKLENPNNKRIRYASEDEESRLMAELPESLQALVSVAIHTGMRRGELLNLKLPDIELYERHDLGARSEIRRGPADADEFGRAGGAHPVT